MRPKLLNSLSSINIFNKRDYPFLERIKHKKSQSSSSYLKKGDKTNHNNNMTILTTHENHNNDKLHNLRHSKLCVEPYEHYQERVKDALSLYHGINMSKLYGDTNSNSNNQICNSNSNSFQLTIEDMQIIKKVQFKSKLFNSNHTKLLNKNGSSVQIKFSGQILFNSPFESLKAIRQNQKVFSDINTTFLSRQFDKMEESINNVENEVMKYNSKMSKLRISPITNISKLDEEEASHQDHYLLDKSHSSKGLKLFSFFKYPNKNFPEGREQFAVIVNHTSNVFMFGGLGSTLQHNSIWSLDLESLEWKKIQSRNQPPPCRYGHTASVFNDQVFLYGGRIKIEKYPDLGENDIFNMNTLSWSTIRYQNGSVPQRRRNHIAEIVGPHLIIHGGLGYDDKLLNDTIVFSFGTMALTQANMSYDSLNLSLYGHASSFVVPSDIRLHSRFNLYKYPEYKKQIRMKEMGIYVFGGITKHNIPSNEVYVLLVGRPLLEWKLIETMGKKPLPRYFLSMHFFEKGNFLILHGGRNDNLGSSSSFALNDTYLLNLSNFDWIEIKLYSKATYYKVLSRCCHSGVIYGNKLIIFGGMNANNYIGSSLFIINLNFKYVHKTIGTSMEQQRRYLLHHYDFCKTNQLKMQRLKELTTKNQLTVISDCMFPFIK